MRHQQREDCYTLQAVIVVIWYFFVSLNHDWIAPILRQFRVNREENLRVERERKQRRQEKKVARREQRELELKQLKQEALKAKQQLRESADKHRDLELK